MQGTKRSVFPLKKSIALIMALSVLVCGVFAACSSKKTDGQNSAADTTQAGLLGGLISGAATGLSADIVSGGLSFGAGALIGGIVGALTAAGATWAFNASTDRQDPHVRFSSEFLRTQVVAGLLRYLAVIHHGRGRGLFIESEAPTFWQAEVEAAVLVHEEALTNALDNASDRPTSNLALAQFTDLLNALARDVLTRLYPQE